MTVKGRLLDGAILPQRSVTELHAFAFKLREYVPHLVIAGEKVNVNVFSCVPPDVQLTPFTPVIV